MDNFNKALKEAVDAGYNWQSRKDYMAGGSASMALATTDPAFWKALGKARGWFDDDEPQDVRFQMHLFIDHLADGKDAESFFASL